MKGEFNITRARPTVRTDDVGMPRASMRGNPEGEWALYSDVEKVLEYVRELEEVMESLEK